MLFTNISAKKKWSNRNWEMSLNFRIPREWLSVANAILAPTTEFKDFAKEFNFLHPIHEKAFAAMLHINKENKVWFVVMDTYSLTIGSLKHKIELFITTDNTSWNIMSSNLNERKVWLKYGTFSHAKELVETIVREKS